MKSLFVLFITSLLIPTLSLQAQEAVSDAATRKKEFDQMLKEEEKIKTTSSGLQYIEMKLGTGKFPEKGQTVVVHYTGWLLDGTKFDSSVDRDVPFEFSLGQGRVIQGWDEGVATMKIGGKRRLIIPAKLGYGDQGAGGVIPPQATLVFDVELLGVK